MKRGLHILHFTDEETGLQRLRKRSKITQLEPEFEPRQGGPTDHALIHLHPKQLWVDRNQEQETEERRGVGSEVVLEMRLG